MALDTHFPSLTCDTSFANSEAGAPTILTFVWPHLKAYDVPSIVLSEADQ